MLQDTDGWGSTLCFALGNKMCWVSLVEGQHRTIYQTVHLMRREDSLEKTLMLGKCEDRRRRGRQRTRWLDRVTEATNMNLTKL